MPPSTTDPERGSFTTVLSYALMHQIRSATRGEHYRIIETSEGKTASVRKPAEQLQQA